MTMWTTTQPAAAASARDAPRLSSWVALFALASGLLVSLVQPLLPRDGVTEVAPFVSALAERVPELKDGDMVLVHPPWRHDVVNGLYASPLLPEGVRATVSLSLAHGQDPGRVLVLRDRKAPPLPRAHRNLRDARVQAEGIETGWLLRPADVPVDDVENDLARLLGRAEVVVIDAAGRRVRCPWDASTQRHRCDDLPSWMYVGLESLMVAGAPSSCAWSHPTSGGKVVIRFPDVALGREIRFAHALSDAVAGRDGGAPVEAAIYVEGKRVLRSVRTNASGWWEERVAIPGGTGRAEVRIEVTTRDDGARHYCWRLRSPFEEKRG